MSWNYLFEIFLIKKELLLVVLMEEELLIEKINLLNVLINKLINLKQKIIFKQQIIFVNFITLITIELKCIDRVFMYLFL
jgi:hypothetical protein